MRDNLSFSSSFSLSLDENGRAMRLRLMTGIGEKGGQDSTSPGPSVLPLTIYLEGCKSFSRRKGSRICSDWDVTFGGAISLVIVCSKSNVYVVAKYILPAGFYSFAGSIEDLIQLYYSIQTKCTLEK